MLVFFVSAAHASTDVGVSHDISTASGNEMQLYSLVILLKISLIFKLLKLNIH